MSTTLSPEQQWRELTSPARLPGLTPSGEAMLRRLRAHPAAPVFRDFSGHRLTPAVQWAQRARHAFLRHAGVQPRVHGAPPAWLWPWWLRQQASVAAWPSLAALRHGWQALPTTSRADLQADLARHVPRHLQSPDLICFTTSGTTGHPIRVPSTPATAASYAALHERALALHGVRLQAGQGDVGVVLAGFQQRCFTYVSVNPLRGECGLAKINLHPGEWHHASDRATYLDAMAPELISGDPVSLDELATLAMQHRPQALLSTSMAMSDGQRNRLAARFGCPVVDVYSMNEAGPIAAFVQAAQGFVLLQPRLFVEILDEAGRALPPGELGEVTLSGGFNPCLPLLRYRTGDHARLVMTTLGPTLRDLQGRPPVRFLARSGAWVNNVELTQALRRFDLQRYALHQAANGGLCLRVAGPTSPELAPTIAGLLGDWPLTVLPLQAEDKVRQYTSELSPPSR
ncbi:capsule biosynthesis protein CapK [Ideonella azotifigens]|uniref:AMP-dependent synthetase/ligase domain-containing protein n=2 Tax=Ideonella azotifigens TaxID=513160 RepID=A0ABN1KJJ3_9BURK|nr:AMP-binding protein [Ideonella azotifigens]MCD2339387.1 capsule biosynthesis protein CapK [Ideonella azotifigens]